MSDANSAVCLLYTLSPRPTGPESIYCNFLADILSAHTILLAVIKLRINQNLCEGCVPLLTWVEGADAYQTVDTSLILDPEVNILSYFVIIDVYCQIVSLIIRTILVLASGKISFITEN